jgi:integrase
MRRQPQPGGDGYRCWLSEDEVDDLLDATRSRRERIGFALCARAGYRSNEAVQARPDHLKRGPSGPMMEIEADQAKTNGRRETPVPTGLAGLIDGIGSSLDDGETLYPKSKRTLRRRIKELAEEAEIDGAAHLSPHDLRRTWTTALREADVDDGLVMRWGGWTDFDTYWEHYIGAFTPDYEQAERGKVGWL